MERRIDDRTTVVWHATLTLEDDSQFPAQVMDVSYAGTLIECDARLDIGQEVILTIADLGDFAAKVKWIKDKERGLTIMGGPDLLLKKFAEASGSTISERPVPPTE